jgi:hypothetical protein
VKRERYRADASPQSRGECRGSSLNDRTDRIALHSPKRVVRPTGFEPVTLGSEDYCASRATINDPNELRQTSDAVVPVLVPSASDPAQEPQIPADLARLGAEWDRLPDAIKNAILALVQAAQGPRA